MPRFFKYILCLGLCLTVFNSHSQTLIVDSKHISETSQESIKTSFSSLLKLVFENPAWKEVSRIEQFFSDASTIINQVLVNLKITKDLIEKEKKIIKLVERAMLKFEQADNLPNKGLYTLMLVEIYGQAITLFEIFDISNKPFMGIMDDEGRIRIIREALLKATTIESSIRTLIRRANQDSQNFARLERETETFKALFTK